MAIDRQYFEFLSGFVTQHKLDLFDTVLAQRTRHLTVVMEDVYQSQNSSACLRSCDCFGIQDVHIIENDHSFEINADIALGAAQWLTLHRHRNPGNNTRMCLEQLRDQGYRLIATSPEADADITSLDVTQPTALLFGTEKEGLSGDALQLANECVRIPMVGFTESFNISVAVAVVLHHLTWQLRQSDIPWQIPFEDRQDLKLLWLKRVLKHRLGALDRRFQSERAENRLQADPDKRG